MQISKQIDQLIHKLTELKPTLSNDRALDQNRFNNILENYLENTFTRTSDTSNATSINTKVAESSIPYWVDPDYGFDPERPRKPNMREMMEAISGKSVEELYSDRTGAWREISAKASEMLHGVVGEKNDTRDWSKIMSAPDILRAAQLETSKMHSPTVDIHSEFDENDNLVNQYAVLKDADGKNLRYLIGNPSQITETMQNFGTTSLSIPSNLKSKISSEKFDPKILEVIENYYEKSQILEAADEFETHAIKTSTDALAKRIMVQIPIEEFEKL